MDEILTVGRKKGCDGMFGYFTFFNAKHKKPIHSTKRVHFQPSPFLFLWLSDEYEALEIFLIMTGSGILFPPKLTFIVCTTI